jgi:hypothetical protein
MSTRKSHLGAAQVHGRKAIRELRHMTADSALFWVLSHKDRVAKFRRSVAGTRAAKPFDQLLALIRKEATALKRPAPRRRNAVRARRTRRERRFPIPSFLIG